MGKVKKLRQLEPSPQLLKFNRACLGGSWGSVREKSGLLCEGRASGLGTASLKSWSLRPSHQLPCSAYLTWFKDG